MVLQYIQYIVIVIFIWINFFILEWDFKKNIIKNKLLLILLCLFLWEIVSHMVLWESTSYIQEYSLITISSVFIISFLLSTFRVWWAGDAKYFFILYLFIWYISPFIYIGNIVLATFLLLLFLFIKNIIFIDKNWIWLWYIIAWDIKRWQNNTVHKFKESHTLWAIWILNIMNEFFLFFLLIKIARELFFILSPLGSIVWISTYINPYFILLAVFVVIVILVRKYCKSFKEMIWKKLWMMQIEVTTLFNLILLIFISILLFILYKDSSIFLSEMYKILTIFFLIHISIRCLLYIYKKCFIEMEKSIIHINDLKFWDYIDKNWMKWRITPLLKDEKIKIKQELSHYTQSPNDIKEIQRLVKRYYRKEPYISIVNSFPYSPVIFIGFVLTYIHNDSYLFIIIDYIRILIV